MILVGKEALVFPCVMVSRLPLLLRMEQECRRARRVSGLGLRPVSRELRATALLLS